MHTSFRVYTLFAGLLIGMGWAGTMVGNIDSRIVEGSSPDAEGARTRLRDYLRATQQDNCNTVLVPIPSMSVGLSHGFSVHKLQIESIAFPSNGCSDEALYYFVTPTRILPINRATFGSIVPSLVVGNPGADARFLALMFLRFYKKGGSLLSCFDAGVVLPGQVGLNRYKSPQIGARNGEVQVKFWSTSPSTPSVKEVCKWDIRIGPDGNVSDHKQCFSEKWYQRLLFRSTYSRLCIERFPF